MITVTKLRARFNSLIVNQSKTLHEAFLITCGDAYIYGKLEVFEHKYGVYMVEPADLQKPSEVDAFNKEMINLFSIKLARTDNVDDAFVKSIWTAYLKGIKDATAQELAGSVHTGAGQGGLETSPASPQGVPVQVQS